MAPESVRIPVQNCLLVVADERIRDIPDIDRHKAVWSTASCILVSCMPDSDGATHVTIGSAKDIIQDGELIFDNPLETPSRKLVVETVLGKKVFQIDVPNSRTRVRIWTNGIRFTDKVTIGVG